MSFAVSDLPLPGLKLIRPRVFTDPRGYFLETHHDGELRTRDIPDAFVQDNLSFSRRSVLRGLHFQYPDWQAKLISVVQGEVFDVAVDVRKGSPTYGRWYGHTLSEANHEELYIPTGFAHGFCVTSESAFVFYKCSAFYKPEHEHTLLWNDPTVAVKWPVTEPVLSEKDARGRRLAELP